LLNFHYNYIFLFWGTESVTPSHFSGRREQEMLNFVSNRIVFAESNKQNRSRTSLYFLSILATVSLPAASSWVTFTPTLAHMHSNLAYCGASMNGLFRSRHSKRYRNTYGDGGCFKLRAQESPKTANDVAVLNERLWSAAENGDEQTIRTLISVGAEVNSQPAEPVEAVEDSKPPPEPIFGPSALHLAAGNGKSKAVCALVELGAEVNIKDSDLATPIHRAVVGGHLGEAHQPQCRCVPRHHFDDPSHDLYFYRIY
jgi:hypothetical protein